MQKAIIVLFICFQLITILHAQSTNGSKGPAYGNYPTHWAADANTPSDYFLIDNPGGKIYFSSRPFKDGSTDDERKFNSSQFIYGRLKLNSGTLNEVFNIASKQKIEYYGLKYAKQELLQIEYEATFYKNNISYKKSMFCRLKMEDLDKNYLDFDVLPSSADASTPLSSGIKCDPFNYDYIYSSPLYYNFNRVFTDDKNAYDEGRYKIKIALRNRHVKDAGGRELPETSTPIFESDFDFDFNAADAPLLIDNGTQADNKVSNLYKTGEIKSKPIPKEWVLKSSPVSGGLTEAFIRKTYVDAVQGAKIAKFYAAPTGGWDVVKNNLGIPIYQYSTQLILLFCKDNEKCWQSEVVLRKDYLGYGKYGKVYMSYNDLDRTNDQNLLPCEKMK